MDRLGVLLVLFDSLNDLVLKYLLSAFNLLYSFGNIRVLNGRMLVIPHQIELSFNVSFLILVLVCHHNIAALARLHAGCHLGFSVKLIVSVPFAAIVFFLQKLFSKDVFGVAGRTLRPEYALLGLTDLLALTAIH